VILTLFSTTDLCYRLIYKGRLYVEIGLVGSLFVSLLVTGVTGYSLARTELHIVTTRLVKQRLARTTDEASHAVEAFVSERTGTHGVAAIMAFSVLQHPILLASVLISCLISFWTTIPRRARKALEVAEALGIVDS
jgi:hypothetical protein